MTVAEHQGVFQIGQVVSRTFGVITRNFVTILIIAALLLLPVLAIALLAGTPSWIVSMRLHGWLLGLLGFLAQIACVYLLQASLVRLAITDLNGETPSLGSALSSGLALILPVFALSIVYLLGFALGLMLLVVPGVILAMAWSVIIPVRVVEGTGIGETFARSRALTKGFRWRIFGLFLMYAVLSFLFSILAATVAGVALSQLNTARASIPYTLVTWVGQLVMAVIGAVGVCAIYYELRTVKEGIAPQQLAAAFD